MKGRDLGKVPDIRNHEVDREPVRLTQSTRGGAENASLCQPVLVDISI